MRSRQGRPATGVSDDVSWLRLEPLQHAYPSSGPKLYIWSSITGRWLQPRVGAEGRQRPQVHDVADEPVFPAERELRGSPPALYHVFATCLGPADHQHVLQPHMPPPCFDCAHSSLSRGISACRRTQEAQQDRCQLAPSPQPSPTTHYSLGSGRLTCTAGKWTCIT